MSRRTRRLLVAGAALAGVSLVWQLFGLIPTEADRVAERVEALGRRVLAGDVEAVLGAVDLARFGLAASAAGETVRFGEGDEDRLLGRARQAAEWLPLQRASLTVTESEVGEDRDGAPLARVTLRFAFEEEGTHYADDFALELRKADRRWVLTAVRLVGQPDPGRMPGGVPGL